MDFEWDEKKRLANIAKHGVDFRRALMVFADNEVIDVADRRGGFGELRRLAIGRLPSGETVLDVYTPRGEKLRIISAWKVGENGKKRYGELLNRSDPGDERQR